MEPWTFSASHTSLMISLPTPTWGTRLDDGTLGSTGSYSPPRSPARFKGGGVGPSAAYSYSAAVVEVEVDPVTGWINIPTIWIGHDIGRSINPTLVRGQVEGGVYMGVGEALMEEQARQSINTIVKYGNNLDSVIGGR